MLTSEQILNTKLDIALSELRDALTGSEENAKTLADLAAILGEKQAAPTAYTILSRIKAIEDKLTAGIQLSGSIAIVKTGDYITQQTNTDLWIPELGKLFVLTDIVISTSTAGTVTLFDGTTVIRKYYFEDNGGAVENMQYFEKSLLVNNHLKITTSVAMTCYVVIKGYEVDENE